MKKQIQPTPEETVTVWLVVHNGREFYCDTEAEALASVQSDDGTGPDASQIVQVTLLKAIWDALPEFQGY